MRHITPQFCAHLSCIFLFLICLSISQAQTPTSPGDSRQDPQNRDWGLTRTQAETNGLRRDFEREKRVAQQTIKEDFRKLQIVNNELMTRTFIRSSNNLTEFIDVSRKDISSSLNEIQNIARRLKSTLKLPEVKTDKNDSRESAGGEGATQDSKFSLGLLNLDQTVTSFVDNPIFQQPRALDAQMSFRAAEDLNRILYLSESLRKLAKQNQRN